MRAMMYQNIDKIIQSHPTHRWVFLTLTVKNPHVSDTRQTLKEMNAGWQRMVQSKRFKGVVDGFIRTTEITRPEKKSERMNVHPHFSRHAFGEIYVFQPRLYKSSGMDGYVD